MSEALNLPYFDEVASKAHDPDTILTPHVDVLCQPAKQQEGHGSYEAGGGRTLMPVA